MNYKLRTNKAFTLIELIVAVAILAMIVAFSSTIFTVSINANRTATANSDIMRKLRAITGQLNRDFAGLRTDAPVFIYFDNGVPSRYDQILFFANGDFQSTQLYDNVTGEPSESGSKVVVGNVARIYYGQAFSLDSRDDTLKDPNDLPERNRILSRRRHILTADADLIDFPMDAGGTFSPFTVNNNDRYEHDNISLAEWKNVNANTWETDIVAVCFEDTVNPADNRPQVYIRDPNDYHKLMCEGLSSFAIQWAYWDSFAGKYYWFPSNDPDGDETTFDSHFDLKGNDQFGVYFNISGAITDWDNIKDGSVEYASGPLDKFASDFFPDAFKFTFTIYDSKGVIEKPKTFTHIVYVGD
ncbi:MAG: type II secretion system protein [Planctomycetes bacterium]|nr:type II secretion system protein [Planctomycetota bacterium]